MPGMMKKKMMMPTYAKKGMKKAKPVYAKKGMKKVAKKK